MSRASKGDREPRKNPSNPIQALRESVRLMARRLARKGDREAFASLENIMQSIGWDNIYAETTCDRLCAAISVLIGIAPYADVLCAAGQCEIEADPSKWTPKAKVKTARPRRQAAA